jgi:ribokinase
VTPDPERVAVMARVVVLGSLNIDTTVRVDRHPSTGETVMAEGRRRGWGGKGGNQAVAAARAGAEVVMIGCVGADSDGEAYVGRLASLGIDGQMVRRLDGFATGTAFIAIDSSGDNTIVVDPGANAEVGDPELAGVEHLAPGDVLMLQAEIPPDIVIEAIVRAKDRGARVVLNLAPYVTLPAGALDACDPVVVNEPEYRQLMLDGIRPSSTVETLGERGARWGDVTVAARVTDVVDTTGAGDAFCGVLAARLAAGDGRKDALAAAVDAATVSVGVLGAQA